VFTTRRYTNTRLPLPLPYQAVLDARRFVQLSPGHRSIVMMFDSFREEWLRSSVAIASAHRMRTRPHERQQLGALLTYLLTYLLTLGFGLYAGCKLQEIRIVL